MNSNYQSTLTEDLDCQQFKNEYQSFLANNMVNEIGYCSFNQTTATVTPTPTKNSLATPTPTPTQTAIPTPIPSPTPTNSSFSTPTPSPFVKFGDINHDGRVNIVDIGVIINNYGSTGTNLYGADVSGDGKVNIVDIGIIIDNYEQ
jgi:hypothetical protein